MEPIPASAEKSVRRSRVRKHVLILISSLGEAYLGQIARALRLPPGRVLWALHGHAPDYRPELSLIAVGLVEERVTEQGRVFVITSRGRRKARSLTSRIARAAERRAWARAEAGGSTLGTSPEPAPPILPTSSVTWTVPAWSPLT